MGRPSKIRPVSPGPSRREFFKRSGSAAAKVEALSSNGMDEIEIPAFLRKQAD